MKKRKAKKETRKVCKTCKYFDLDFIEDEHDRESWCRRYPPVYIGPKWCELDCYDGIPNKAIYWEEPTVGIAHWCGEWKPRGKEHE